MRGAFIARANRRDCEIGTEISGLVHPDDSRTSTNLPRDLFLLFLRKGAELIVLCPNLAVQQRAQRSARVQPSSHNVRLKTY